MLRASLISLLLTTVLLAQTTSIVAGSYNIIVSPNGNSLVIAEFSSSEAKTQNVPLPLDATDFRVSGALYVPSSNGIDLSVTPTQNAIVIFSSALLVTGSTNNYRFSLDLPGIDNTVTVSLPKDAVVQSTIPQAQVTQTGNAVNIIWGGNQGGTSVSIQYTLSGGVSGGDNSIILFVGVIIVVIAAVFLALRFKKKV